ncbi:Transport and Golgi organisation 2 [Lutibacter oricola]|uniref:Transport and Golgi organisation 2 n=1 Tax=Lutibacter oricola TaxID=762486 RepID=A0A1H2SYE8_9FLAO|nr:NRDE family protein [Lutibacter oricola]SDW36495.1 Transport and Golgi organisation 2 [Lutibacter oricola]
MCTVTFLPLEENNFILTSSRDENRNRETILPKKYIEDDVELMYPKDKIAGGTWIGESSKNRLVCVLNGAFINHIKKGNYKKSRGVIAKDILKSNNFISYVEGLNLEGIEPFTMVILDWNKELSLFELIWDEKTKHFTLLEQEPKIWSSSTLYSNVNKVKRKNLFNSWMQENKFTSKNILQFHHSEEGDKEQAILMKRTNVETVSITSIKKQQDSIQWFYKDVVNSEVYEPVI